MVKKKVVGREVIMQIKRCGRVLNVGFDAVIFLKSVGEIKYHRYFLFTREKKCIFAKYF